MLVVMEQIEAIALYIATGSDSEGTSMKTLE